MNQIFDKTLQALAASNRMRELRQNITSANIANAETAGYKAKKIDFEEALRAAVEQRGVQSVEGSHKDHFVISSGSMGPVHAEIYDNPEVNVSNDGNTVDLEKEMATMFENNLMHRAANQLINKKLAALKYAATEGGR